jgi:hypothetical protein
MKNKEKSVSHRLPCEASAKRGTATVGLYPCTAGLCVSVALWQIWANMASRRLRYPLPAFAGLPAIPTSSLEQAKKPSNHWQIRKSGGATSPQKHARFVSKSSLVSQPLSAVSERPRRQPHIKMLF